MPISPQDLDAFERDGFVVVRDVLRWNEDLQPVATEYENLLDRLLRQWQRDGHLKTTFRGMPFGERLTRAASEAKQPFDLDFDISLPQANIKQDTPMHHGPAVFQLLRSPRLLDCVEDFIGPEIYSNPVQHSRIKLPEHQLPEECRTGLTARIAWHQDSGVVTSDADDTDMLTVWFPMTTATIENGCLSVVPGSHREGVELHCRSRDKLTLNQVCIPEQLIRDDYLPLPMEPGDVLFMHRRTKHSGLPNRGNTIRWSFDLRYQPTGQPTGRPWFPGFVARSRAHPDTELRDPERWDQLWRDARDELADSDDIQFNRWKEGDPRCA